MCCTDTGMRHVELGVVSETTPYHRARALIMWNGLQKGREFLVAGDDIERYLNARVFELVASA